MRVMKYIMYVLVTVGLMPNSYASFSSVCKYSSDMYNCCLAYDAGYSDALNDLNSIEQLRNNDVFEQYSISPLG